MFTGIIEDLGTVKSIEKRGAFGKISIEAGSGLGSVKLGDSIAVNGACLTVSAFSGRSFSADISEESCRVTTLGDLKAGERVNIEYALTLSKQLGGHIVTGHVDGIGVIKRKVSVADSMELHVGADDSVMRQIVKKGSVAIDGISLTIADLTEGVFKVAIIPHTLKNTTLPCKAEGARVNIETDIIGKYVEKYFESGKKKGITEAFLSEHGFFNRK